MKEYPSIKAAVFGNPDRNYAMTMEEASKRSKELRDEGGEIEERLRAKCRWEHMSRTAILTEWGDPATW